jgi:chemotaxis protein MotB
MAKWFLVLLLVIAVGLGALWFWMYRPQEQALAAARADAARLQSEAALARERARALEGEVADLQTVRGELQRASLELQQQVQQKEGELSSIRSTQDELVSGLKQEIESNQIQVQRIRDQLRVDLVDEVLFDSGESDVKPAGKAVLQKVGDALKKADGRRIEVHGHTDNVPIVGALAKRYPSNWELSAARAVNVSRFLQQTGVDPVHLSATARSEYQPRAENGTDEGRRKNRRIEILLGPRIVDSAVPKPETAPPTTPTL